MPGKAALTIHGRVEKCPVNTWASASIHGLKTPSPCPQSRIAKHGWCPTAGTELTRREAPSWLRLPALEPALPHYATSEVHLTSLRSFGSWIWELQASDAKPVQQRDAMSPWI